MRTTTQEALQKDADLRHRCAAVLEQVLKGAAIRWGSARGAKKGGEITLRGTWGTKTFSVESRNRISAQDIQPLIARIRVQNHARPLLMSEFIHPHAGLILRNQDINFVDAAGNIYLNHPPLFVWQQGFKRELPAHRPNRTFQFAGLKLLSVLLWEPQLANASYLDLARRAGISAGAIVPIFGDMAKDGFLTGVNKTRRLTRLRELLEQWVIGYAGQLFPRLILKSCRLVQGRNIASLAEELRFARFAENTLLGGELVAGMATSHLRPQRASIFLRAEDQGVWMKRLKLIPDPEGNVDLIQRFAEGNQWADPPAALEGIRCTNPVLLYGEMLRTGTDDRLRETAGLLFQKYISPRFGESG